mgnify:CR=1 FL=1
MFLRIFLLFTIIEMIEFKLISAVYNIIAHEISTEIAFMWTTAEIIFTFLFALKLFKRIGPHALQSIMNNLHSNQEIQSTINQSFSLLLSGLLLLIPGYLTDIFGIFLLLGANNKLLKSSHIRLNKYLRKVFLKGSSSQQKNSTYSKVFYTSYYSTMNKKNKKPIDENTIDVEPIDSSNDDRNNLN